jgi:hypothetical protein
LRADPGIGFNAATFERMFTFDVHVQARSLIQMQTREREDKQHQKKGLPTFMKRNQFNHGRISKKIGKKSENGKP